MRETLTVAEATRKSMRANRGTETAPERRLRKALWADGLRGYRKNVRHLPGKPDVVFGRARLAVFVHGCYWHQCPHCTRNLTPKTNAAFWQAKFAANEARDGRNREALAAMGYRVHTVWECQMKDMDALVAEIRGLLDAPGEAVL
ncbi:MAG: very short patch repair endonuclease [Fimbriimonas sp.]